MSSSMTATGHLDLTARALARPATGVRSLCPGQPNSTGNISAFGAQGIDSTGFVIQATRMPRSASSLLISATQPSRVSLGGVSICIGGQRVEQTPFTTSAFTGTAIVPSPLETVLKGSKIFTQCLYLDPATAT
ncbi:MAG: hypothetical protein AAGG01_09500 [Planctomycetota bacterium]